MLVLAVDTSTPAVTCGLVRVGGGAVHPVAARATVDARAHAEVLTPQVLECLEEAGLRPPDIQAVVVGTGPGPYTGLRVGMATAAAFGDALGVPVHGVCSLDAIAAQVGPRPQVLVVTDARRREVYWARYADGARVEGPGVAGPADLPAAPSLEVAGSAAHAALFGLPVLPVTCPTPAGLVRAALGDLLAGGRPGPLVPLYLRRPDAEPRLQRRPEGAVPPPQRRPEGAVPPPQRRPEGAVPPPQRRPEGAVPPPQRQPGGR